MTNVQNLRISGADNQFHHYQTLANGLGLDENKMTSSYSNISSESSISSNSDFDNQIATERKQGAYDNKVNLKILFSRIAMHLSRGIRDQVFSQLDELLDEEDFSEEDSLINENSFQTFLRFISLAKIIKRPALTVSVRGFLGASWRESDVCSTIDFLPNGQARTIVSRKATSGNTQIIGSEGDLPTSLEYIKDNHIKGILAHDHEATR